MGLFGKNYSNQTDEDLMVLIAEKNAKAFEELYHRYSGRINGYFYRMLWKDKLKAEDFTQDLFTKLVTKPHLYNPERPFKTWVFSVANNMCKNEYKKQEVRKGTNLDMGDHDPVGEKGEQYIDRLDKEKLNEVLDKELEKLKPEHKETFELRFREELSIKEIAEILDCSEGTIKSRLFYTLKKLGPGLQIFHSQTNLAG